MNIFKKREPRREMVTEIYNDLSLEEKAQMLSHLTKDLLVVVQQQETYCIDDGMWVSGVNGTLIQLNLDGEEGE